MCSINCSGGCKACAPEEHGLLTSHQLAELLRRQPDRLVEVDGPTGEPFSLGTVYAEGDVVILQGVKEE